MLAGDCWGILEFSVAELKKNSYHFAMKRKLERKTSEPVKRLRELYHCPLQTVSGGLLL
jgi:hypothetical protein